MAQREDTITMGKARGRGEGRGGREGAGKTSHYSQHAELVFLPGHRDSCSQISRSNGNDSSKEKENHGTTSCSPDYLKSETVQYNCISKQLTIKYEITWLRVKTNAPEAVFLPSVSSSAETFSVCDYTFNTLHCTTRHAIVVNLTQDKTKVHPRKSFFFF